MECHWKISSGSGKNLKPASLLTVKMSDCDNASVSSAGSRVSISNTKRPCPVCKKEFKTTSLFKHIKTKHDAHWFESMYANDRMLRGIIEKSEPVPFMYTEKNDFDEDETKDIYGCLACYNSFTHKGHGTTHCNKAKCKAAHIKECKTLLQRVEDMKEKMKNRVDYRTWTREKFCREIEGYIRWYKYIKNGTLYRTLLTAYNKRRAERTASSERALTDRRNEIYGTNQLHTYCHYTHFPIIRDIPEYECTYDKTAPNMLYQYHYWGGIVSTIEHTYVYMRQHYDNEADPEMFMSMDENEPARLFIDVNSIEQYLHKLPPL